MGRQLKIWNGRAYGVLPQSQWKRGTNSAHVYVCAHSVRDLQALCVELGLDAPCTSEVSKYWSPGCWGNSMDGIVPERGVWVGYGRDKPERILPTNGGAGAV